MTTLALLGIPLVMAQTEVYALPARAHVLISSAVLSLSEDNVTFTSVAASTTGMVSAYAYAKCTGSTATLLCKLQ